MESAPTRGTLKSRLLAMMVIRVVLALAFLGIIAWFQVKEYSFASLNFFPIYVIVAAVGLLTIFYALLLNRVSNSRFFAYCQIAVDIALATVIVFVTGGTDSYLHALYPLSVIGAAILLGKSGGFFAASFASIAYGVLIDFDFYGMLPVRYKIIDSPVVPAWEDVFMTVSTNILAFFTVAYLIGYLAERAAKVEKELEEKEIDYGRLEALNRQIIGNITSGIMTLDEKGRITSFNREAGAVTGYTLREVYYRDVDEIFPGMVRAGSRAGHRVEERYKKSTGEEIYLGFSISPGQGGEVANIVIFQDLTRLKAMEEELRRDEKLKALGELSVGIAHEIRNPLASISGSIQMLREETDPAGDNRRLMDIILRETERLNQLITDYLLFAKPARELKDTVDLGSLLAETMEVFRNSPVAAAIKTECSVDASFRVLADARQLGQVFWNLFLNAAHAMPGGGTLSVEAERVLDGGSRGGPGAEFVAVTVADTGGGIAPEDLKRIFDPFFSTREEGTGLGLAIVHRIIESHNGRVEVTSAKGEGTSFRILLPVDAMAEALKA